MEHQPRAMIYLLCVILLSAALALAACSPQPASFIPPMAASTAQLDVSNSPAPAAGEIRPIITPTTTSIGAEAARDGISPAPHQGNKSDSPAGRSYHAVLMFERAADLLLAVIEKIQAGQISQNDPSAISPYVDAFAVAIDAFNQAAPPGELDDAWTQVYMAAQQYNQAYTMLIRGMWISPQNLAKLRSTRKLLVMDQEMVEKYLAQSGFGPDFRAAQQRAVDQHLQQSYGVRPVPALLP